MSVAIPTDPSKPEYYKDKTLSELVQIITNIKQEQTSMRKTIKDGISELTSQNRDDPELESKIQAFKTEYEVQLGLLDEQLTNAEAAKRGLKKKNFVQIIIQRAKNSKIFRK